MTLQSSGQMTFTDIQTEFGGSNPISLDEYYGAASGIPSSGQISMNQFYGKSGTYSLTLTVGYDDTGPYKQATGFGIGGNPFNTSNSNYVAGTTVATPNHGSVSNPLWTDGTNRIYFLGGRKVGALKANPSYHIELRVEGLHTLNSFNTLTTSFGTYQTSAANVIFQRSDIAYALAIGDVTTGTGVNGSTMYGPLYKATHNTSWEWPVNVNNIPLSDEANNWGRTIGSPIIGSVGTTHSVTVT